ncbi:uncharacterized protein LOC141632749 [Silene latifolia]|uniref:uncharacterized protein LOC141632749 n=1 Tax=Silene latifolia TaxID=37657 RepID=UPI003D7781F3
MSLVDYYSKLKNIWENLDSLDPLPICSCGKMDLCSCTLFKRIIEREQNAKLIQFLMGLNGAYDTIRTQILSIDPLPSISKTLGLLKKIERQRQIYDGIDVITNANAYAVSNQFASKQANWQNSKTESGTTSYKFCTFCNMKGHDLTNCFMLNKCSHCNKPGHKVENCYGLHGYPSKGKAEMGNKSQAGGSKGKRGANNAELKEVASPLDDFDDTNSELVPVAPATHNTNLYSSVIDGIVNSVIDQVLKRLTDSNTNLVAANFAGILSSSLANVVSHRKFLHDWIIDTGASDYMTFDLSILHDIKLLSPSVLVSLPDGSSKLGTHMGTIYLIADIILLNVFFIPDFKQNLLSVGRLIDDGKFTVLLKPSKCLFQAHFSNKTIAIGRRQGELYGIQHFNKPILVNKVISLVKRALQHRLSSNVNSNNLNPTRCNSSNNATLSKHIHLLHARTGHMPVKKLKLVLPIDCSNENEFHCESFVLAKHHKLPFPLSFSRASRCFELLHMDVWGPYRTPELSGATYFLTLLDDHSRTTWTILFQNKGQVSGLVKNFILHIETQFNAKVKTIRTDNGTEFL